MGGERTHCSNPTNDFKTGCWLNDAAKGQGDPRLLSSFQLAEGQTGPSRRPTKSQTIVHNEDDE